VRNPGFYDIQKQGETILDVITQAGGIAGSAGPTVYFSPAQGAYSAIDPVLLTSADTDIASTLKGRNPLEIDLTDLYQGRPVPALGIPVRDGDLVAVQQGGEIFVGGWVEKPALYQLQPAMTVTQAITKAGGLGDGHGARRLARARRQGLRGSEPGDGRSLGRVQCRGNHRSCRDRC
jgi:protein involved in polysaccharide export with SLBB domain